MRVRLMLRTVHLFGLTSIILSFICLIHQQYVLAYIFCSTGISHCLTAIVLFIYQSKADLKIVNKHLAESVFGPTAECVKQEIKEEVKYIVSEMKNELKEEASKLFRKESDGN